MSAHKDIDFVYLRVCPEPRLQLSSRSKELLEVEDVVRVVVERLGCAAAPKDPQVLAAGSAGGAGGTGPGGDGGV